MGHSEQQYTPSERESLRKGILKNILTDNSSFAQSRGPGYFNEFAAKQTPRMTIVTCADSRIHEHAFDNTPDSDIFMVRNIGNQINTARGSVCYGINHLHTPILLILGHTGCGAVQAASGDYSHLEPQVREELDTIRIEKGCSNLAGVTENIHDQVHEAIKLFDDKVRSGELVVIGAVYDFRNDMGRGHGILSIININGDMDENIIASSPLLQF